MFEPARDVDNFQWLFVIWLPLYKRDVIVSFARQPLTCWPKRSALQSFTSSKLYIQTLDNCLGMGPSHHTSKVLFADLVGQINIMLKKWSETNLTSHLMIGLKLPFIIWLFPVWWQIYDDADESIQAKKWRQTIIIELVYSYNNIGNCINVSHPIVDFFSVHSDINIRDGVKEKVFAQKYLKFSSKFRRSQKKKKKRSS